MNRYLPNKIITNVLSKDDIIFIKDQIKKTDYYVLDTVSTNVWSIELPSNILDKFKKIAKDVSGVDVKLIEYQVAQYSKKIKEINGKELHPLLFPHVDVFSGPRITLDYQLESNRTWPICVDFNNTILEHTLKDNELVSFSGTHQIHWRPKTTFKDDEFLTMIFFNFETLDAKEILNEHRLSLQNKALKIFKSWNKEFGVSRNVGDEESDIKRYIGEDKL